MTNQKQTSRILFIAIIIYLLTQSCHSFIVSSTKGFRKCYYSDISHDKSMNVRFGFARQQKQNCKFQLQVNYLVRVDGSQEQQNPQNKGTKLYSGMFTCYQMRPRQPFVYKHTPDNYQYSGHYQICVENLEDFNIQPNNTLFQLQIMQKFDPTLLADSKIPLVGSTQIIQFQGIVMEIKRIISRCNIGLKGAQQAGYQLAKNLASYSSSNLKATYLQILFLIVYGVIWVLVVKGLNKQKK